VGDTGVRRRLADGGYEQRLRECRSALEALREGEKNIRALRDVTLEMLDRHGPSLSPALLSRATHVVRENERVLLGANALEGGDISRLGALISESHASLRDLYEVSSPELDAMVEAMTARPEILGARLVGAGFGGCAIGVAKQGISEEAIREIDASYRERTGRDGGFFVTRPGPGARVMDC